MSVVSWQALGFHDLFPFSSKIVDGLDFAIAELLGKINKYFSHTRNALCSVFKKAYT